MRLFFGLTLPAPVRAVTAAYARDAQAVIPGRYADAANHHITLAFLGEVPPERLPEAEAVLAHVAAGFPAPLLTLGEPSHFGRAQNAIFILRVHSHPALEPLHAALADALLRADLPADPGPFSPHITLARHAVLPERLPSPPGAPAFTAQAAHVFSSARDEAGRLGEVAGELAFCKRYEREVHTLLDALAAGEIPLRVTHNDTKLNNVLLDAKTGRGVCVIDLDTVMPGLAAYDFGDSIRFGANTAAEDERDLSKVGLSLTMFEAFTRGFLGEAGQVMSRREIELLPMGAKLMTLECGMRFLADYLNGDKYFRVHRPGHNLDRARTQFALVRSMEDNWDAMMRIVTQV